MFLPIYSSSEKKFLNDLKTVVEEYVGSHENCTYDDVIERFDEPAEVAFNYITSLDQLQLSKRVSLRKAIRNAIIVITMIALGFFCVRTYMLFDLYKQNQEQTITQELIVIE